MIPAFLLLGGDFFLCAVRVHDVRVIQVTGQAGFNRINIDPAKLVSLHNLFVGQTFGFCLCSQLVDSCDDFVHIHSYTSHIALNYDGNTAFFRGAAHGAQTDLAKTAYGNFIALNNDLIRLLAG